jgi:hypothetical protein
MTRKFWLLLFGSLVVYQSSLSIVRAEDSPARAFSAN